MKNNKVKPPVFAYDEFGITNAEFYNVDFANDNQVFLNPYFIESLDNPVAKKATNVAVNFFDTIRQLILSGDKAKASSLFCNYLSEPKETCFGYSKYGINGRGINELAQYILDTIYEDNAVLCNVIKRIEDIKLFIPNISDDRVSDLYTNVIRKVLLEYTAEQCRLYNQNMSYHKTDYYWDVATTSWKQTHELHYFGRDKLPKLLVPKCFINGTKYTTSKFNSYLIIPDFIEQELENPDSNIVKTCKNGNKTISKKDMRKTLSERNITLNKEYAKEFAKTHINCVDIFRYKLEETRQKRVKK